MAFPYRTFGDFCFHQNRLLCGLLILFLCGWSGGCRKGKEVSVKEAKPLGAEVPVSAAVMTIEPQPWPAIVRTQGNLVADDVAVVGAKVAGRVAQTVVELGQEVHEGDPLVRLDPVEFEMQVTQAEAQLLQARSAVGLKPGDPLEKLEPLNALPCAKRGRYGTKPKQGEHVTTNCAHKTRPQPKNTSKFCPQNA